ncbi:hypothetical protein [Acetobacter thailandicus]|uniref:hypothetical protein n=1 Tax=Acetobacter thailandicus TaxID=1502842 RepID=UPI001BA69FBD|nr:hypothetical protein [Acetobacter thailandicus]MBS0959817.1 hypothetical protein [Acetobacter thailandicus]
MMNNWTDNCKVLHVIAQYDQHDDAHIIGTRAGLLRLRDAIDSALSEVNVTKKASVITNDGEGYVALIRCISGDDVDSIPLGYTADYAKDDSEWPEFMK